MNVAGPVALVSHPTSSPFTFYYFWISSDHIRTLQIYYINLGSRLSGFGRSMGTLARATRIYKILNRKRNASPRFYYEGFRLTKYCTLRTRAFRCDE